MRLLLVWASLLPTAHSWTGQATFSNYGLSILASLRGSGLGQLELILQCWLEWSARSTCFLLDLSLYGSSPGENLPGNEFKKKAEPRGRDISLITSLSMLIKLHFMKHKVPRIFHLNEPIKNLLFVCLPRSVWIMILCNWMRHNQYEFLLGLPDFNFPAHLLLQGCQCSLSKP